MDRFCTQCGKLLEDGMRFCVHCGFEAGGGLGSAKSQYDGDDSFTQNDRASHQNQINRDEGIGRGNQYNQGDGISKHSGPYPEILPQTVGGGRKKRTAIIIAALLFVVLALACLYFYVIAANPCIMGDPDVSPSQADGAVSETVSEAGQQGLQGVDYLPAPGLKVEYYERLLDGTEGPCTKYTAKLSSGVPASEVHIFVDGNNEEFAWVSHYIQKEDGIYIVGDTDIFEHIKILPAVIKEGDTWTREWPEGAMVMEVMAVGVNCELDFATLRNCVVIHNDNQAVGFDFLQYYAPGMGLVKEESIEGNHVNMEVTAYQLLNAQEAVNIVGKHTFQVSQLEASIK